MTEATDRAVAGGDGKEPLAQEYLCHGVYWRGESPRLDLVDIQTVAPVRPLLLERRVGLRVVSALRWCTGRYGFEGPSGIEHVPCPKQDWVQPGSSQCLECTARDEFRFAHQVHRSGAGSAALRSYLAQPHWVYIATFADGTSKVGTAADVRKGSRLDEQGPARATYVARAADGRTARLVEDALTQSLGIAQSKRATAKAAAWASAVSAQQIEENHTSIVQTAIALGRGWRGSRAEYLIEPWQLPPAMDAFVGAVGSGRCPEYPHDLRQGEHSFWIVAMAGPIALAHLTHEPNAQRFVVNLGALKGYRLVLGDFSPPPTAHQVSLF